MKKQTKTLNPQMFDAIREYAKIHTIQETADEFGMSVSTINWVKRYDSFKEMKAERSQKQREYYRRVNKTSLNSPFDGDTAPKSIIPIDAQQAPPQDGEVVVTKEACRWEGKGVKEWADEAKKWEEIANELNIELDKAKEDFVQAQKKIKILQDNLDLLGKEQSLSLSQPVLDSTSAIFVKVGEVEISVPIPQKL